MSSCKSGICGGCVDDLAEQFRVTPSFRDNLSFSASMIDPNAMDAQLEEINNGGSNTNPANLPTTTTTSIVHHKWGWWALAAPFVL